MIELQRDLWSMDTSAICITTNGDTTQAGLAVMGRGVALDAATRWPEVRRLLGDSLRSSGNHVCSLGRFGHHPDLEQHRSRLTVLDNEPDPFELVCFPVKHHWNERADLDLIARSARELVSLAAYKGWNKVALPRPGCGNGGRHWHEVFPILVPLLDNRFVVCFL